MAVLEARGLTAGYGERVVLEAVTLQLAPQRTCAILGPGGSGKSTLLKVFAGAGREPGFWCRGAAEVPGRVAWLRQRREPPDATLAALVRPSAPGEASAVLRRVWGGEARVREALEPVLSSPARAVEPNLWRLAAYTGAVAGDEPVLLLDEPEASLRGEWLAAVGRQLAGEKGRRTVVLVTHHVALARASADAAVLLVDGRVLEAAEKDDFFERPAHQRTRDFVRMGC